MTLGVFPTVYISSGLGPISNFHTSKVMRLFALVIPKAKWAGGKDFPSVLRLYIP